MAICIPHIQCFIAVRSLTFVHTFGMSISKPSGRGCWVEVSGSASTIFLRTSHPHAQVSNPESAGQDNRYLGLSGQFISTAFHNFRFCMTNLQTGFYTETDSTKLRKRRNGESLIVFPHAPDDTGSLIRKRQTQNFCNTVEQLQNQAKP